MTDDAPLIDYARDRFGVPQALLDKALRHHERTGRPLANVLVEMGVLSPDQVRSFEEGFHEGSAADIWGEPTRVDKGQAAEPPAPAASPAAVKTPRVAPPLTPQPASEDLESVSFTTRIGDSVAEAAAARRQRAVEVAEHHARWLPHLQDPNRRYRIGEEIARGGMGRIVEVEDCVLGRTVAMKLLIGGPEEQLALQVRFTEEAQITGQLEHPNIVPVHDLGLDEHGQLYFTMKRVGGRTLRDVLKALRKGDGVMAAAFPLHRLLEGYKLICLAIAYAHSRGVIHRDLKPSNIMFGDFGEVLVMDWGLAKIVPSQATTQARVTSLRDGDMRWATRLGEVIGTPGYMPPELAMGQLDDVDPRSDVYSMGALLYEILTLRPPYAGGDSKEILKRQLREPLVTPRERAPERDIPQALERICLRCLQRDMDRRYASALALHADVDAFMAGALEQARQSETANRLVAEGSDQAEAWRRRTASLERLEAEVLRLTAQVAAAASTEQLRPIWAAELALERTRAEQDDNFGRAERAFRQALAEAPDHSEARVSLADLYADGLLAAERSGDEALRRRQAERLLAVDRSRHAALHMGHGRLRVSAEPLGARATLFKVEPQDFVLTPCDAEELGVVPRDVEGLSAGRYLVVLRAPGCHAVQVPVRLGRGEEAAIHVRLRADNVVGREFAHIPGSRFPLGGDLAALRALPGHRIELADFCLARLPVTCRQYLAFLNALHARDPAEASRRGPRLFPDGVSLFAERPDGWAIPPKAPDGGLWDPHWPVFGISAADAEAYCAWRSAIESRRYRLPTEHEWEAAARGADGRKFVWGDRFLPALCKNAGARPGPLQLEACGAYPSDRSPYGVMDLAGGVADWTAHSPDQPRTERVCKGGSFMTGEPHARAASRQVLDAAAVAPWVGFRLAHDPE